MTSTVTEKAVVGRRITLTYYRDLELPEPPVHPGIITGVGEDRGSVWIRLDGRRCNLAARPDYRGLTYLDEVVPVPKLPMGPFTPVADDENGFFEKAGVLLAAIGEDGENLILLTDNRDKAREAAYAYDTEVGVDTSCVNYDNLQPCWAVFEWQPEDSEAPWNVRWDASEGDDQAIRIHYLPA